MDSQILRCITCVSSANSAAESCSTPAISALRGQKRMHISTQNLQHSAPYLMARYSSAILSVALALGGAFYASSASAAQAPGQTTFNTPEEAVKALVAAAKDEDR